MLWADLEFHLPNVKGSIMLSEKHHGVMHVGPSAVVVWLPFMAKLFCKNLKTGADYWGEINICFTFRCTAGIA